MDEIYKYKIEMENINKKYLQNKKKTMYILFNKGRYIETDFYSASEQRKFTLLTGIKPEVGMLVASKAQMPKVYKALGIMGIKAITKVDWI